MNGAGPRRRFRNQYRERVFSVAGTCVSAGGGSGTIASGLLGQFPFYASSGATLTGTSTLFLSTAGNIGVNTNAPATSLDVNGPCGGNDFHRDHLVGPTCQRITGNSDFSGIDFSADNLSSPVARIASYASPSGSYLQFGTTNSYGSGLNTAMTMNPTGNFGHSNNHSRLPTGRERHRSDVEYPPDQRLRGQFLSPAFFDHQADSTGPRI